MTTERADMLVLLALLLVFACCAELPQRAAGWEVGMGRAGGERAAIEGGLTLRQVAEQLSARLGFEVTPQQVHYLAKRKGAVTVGRTAITVPRTVEVDAIAPGDLDTLEAAARVALRLAQDMP